MKPANTARNAEAWDVAVVGAGHAGCEAALAAARLGVKTVLFALSLDSVAMMPCNPNIGGSSKGHLVREVDALGGQMGKSIDETFIQSRILNASKGPAVYSLRAQADKEEYSRAMKKALYGCGDLTLRQAEITGILTENGAVCGLCSETGKIYPCGAAVLCTGTYLAARCLCGEYIRECGPGGLPRAVKLRDALVSLGIGLYRFKTGTPARVSRNSIDFSKTETQYGDAAPSPFSFETPPESIRSRAQEACYLTYTTDETHAIIRENLRRSPMYSGEIKGTGTRYCPSIEDKVVRFAQKERHQVFIEPEGRNSGEMYIAGMSTSLPEDVQERMYRSVPGLENCRITRNGYAIEYDCIDATQLSQSLEFKSVGGLFAAGQTNGSSGYEEAAAQGIVAGANAALKLKGCEPLVISRSEGYVGVLIDDLVIKGTAEPYRMMTSRAEYRLLLRQDNADLRLTEKGYSAGLIPKDRYERFLHKKELIEGEIKRVTNAVIPPGDEINAFLSHCGSAPIITGAKLSDLIKRPELDYFSLSPFDAGRPGLPEDAAQQVNVQIKYEGYIRRQIEQVRRFNKMEDRALPQDTDYSLVTGLRAEAVQKLNRLKPASVGQASRISGVSPADLAALLIYMKIR